jgi:hypothetical protein
MGSLRKSRSARQLTTCTEDYKKDRWEENENLPDGLPDCMYGTGRRTDWMFLATPRRVRISPWNNVRIETASLPFRNIHEGAATFATCEPIADHHN